MYTLYYSPGSASMVVHLALLETGAPYRLELVDVHAGGQRDPAYLKVNPQGVVPTLVIDGTPMTESAALLVVLAERHPGAGLAPAPGSAERQAWYRWIVYLSNTLAATYRFWSLREGTLTLVGNSIKTNPLEPWETPGPRNFLP